ncbi:acidic phospholipase A2-like [Physella acuta]|uniref:acidic phospholipase A2-like n=1 Tax=Physella acuta TaxID=109671 RepID=UPI0027DE46AF|nr:acidic phospholipase A2-like [Physella acuta]XP_059140531.1 acidic phospholipase A2-like [Physella acuta]
MATFVILSILLMQFAGRCSSSDHIETRSRKSLLDLNDMLSTVTGRSAYSDYNGYGCYCGSGGQGTPVDATDRCCQAHDRCYDQLTNCSPKWQSYKYSCTGKSCTCSTANIGCASQICKCDLVFSNCAASSPFNVQYKNYKGKC